MPKRLEILFDIRNSLWLSASDTGFLLRPVSLSSILLGPKAYRPLIVLPRLCSNFFLENENRGTTRHCVHFEYKERVKYLHDAWVVRWQATDSLPLALPTVTGTQTITEWYPHNTATFSPTDSPSGQSGNGIIVGTLVLAVVLPVVTVSLVVAACVFGLRKRRQERRKKAEAQQQALEGQTK